jgi:Kef-type K+ transport system membrane component KefB
LSDTILFDVGIVMICGLLFGRLAKLLKMPNVTGYLIAGLILGPCVLGMIPSDMVTNFSVASDMALGFIAFSIGGEFKISYFKQVGIAPIVIAITESIGAVLFVMITCILLGFNLQLSILLGAIAAATAPAQTIMVVRQYQAKGPMTSMLMSVVALDDATALIAFGFAATIVKSMNAHQALYWQSILMPLYEVLVSFVIGIILSLVMTIFFRFFKKPSNRLCVVVGLIFLTSWLANLVQGSSLLACMALGGGLANLFDDADRLFEQTETFTPPLYMLFFAMSGAGFDLGALKNIGLIGITYVIMRVLGKMFGAWVGGKLTHSDPNICKYLGPTLMPQAGVALGLILVAEAIVPEYGAEIRTIILCSTFLYSILGPSVAKWALVKAGEIVLPPKKKKAGT